MRHRFETPGKGTLMLCECGVARGEERVNRVSGRGCWSRWVYYHPGMGPYEGWNRRAGVCTRKTGEETP